MNVSIIKIRSFEVKLFKLYFSKEEKSSEANFPELTALNIKLITNKIFRKSKCVSKVRVSYIRFTVG